VHLRDHVELGAAGPERGVQGGHVPQEAGMLVQRDGRVGGGDQPRRDVAHQQGTAATGDGLGGGHDRLVDAFGQPTEDPQHTEEHRAHASQHRKQRGDLGRHVGAHAEAGQALTPKDGHLADDLQQPVGEAEEEARECDPEHDLSRCEVGCVVGFERAAVEQRRHHCGDQHR